MLEINRPGRYRFQINEMSRVISFEEPALRAHSAVDILLMKSKIKFRLKAKVQTVFARALHENAVENHKFRDDIYKFSMTRVSFLRARCFVTRY